MTVVTANNFTRRHSGRHGGGRSGFAGRSGFTLIELILVLMIVTIFLAVAVPQLRGFMAGAAARDAATQVVALAQYARAKAAAEAVVYRLSFNEASGEYQLTAGTADGSGQFGELGTDLGEVFTLPTGMKVTIERLNSVFAPSPTATAGDIDFRPDGTSDPVVIRLTDVNGNETLIAAPAPTEPFRITTEQEVNEL